MIRFYASDIVSNPVLPESDSGHCCRVLRMKEGDTIQVVDGCGHAYDCIITDAHPKHTALEITQIHEEPKHWVPYITLAVAPTKNIDRMEWLLEKAVEIGVDRIVFLKCRRSERKEVKDERLIKILVSAMKQSMKSTLPEFDGMVDFKKFISEKNDSQKFMGYCDDSNPLLKLTDEYHPAQDVTILIGPEGDFSEDEVKMAVEAGYIPVTFGDTRLRTETAALYALSTIHISNDLCNGK